MGGLPRDVVEGDAEAAAIAAAGRLVQSRWSEADALLTAAERAIPSLPAHRRDRAETALATVQLFRARRLGDVASVIDEASARLHPDSGTDPELAALALMNLGIARDAGRSASRKRRATWRRGSRWRSARAARSWRSAASARSGWWRT